MNKMRSFLGNFCCSLIPRCVSVTLVMIVALAWSSLVSSCRRTVVDTSEPIYETNMSVIAVNYSNATSNDPDIISKR